MNKLEKLEILLKQIEEHNLTAYEIGKYTKISKFPIKKTTKKERKKPKV